MQESMTILLQKLQALSGLTGSTLVIEISAEGVELAIGATSYFADTLNTETLSSALMHMSMQLGARMTNEETETETAG